MDGRRNFDRPDRHDNDRPRRPFDPARLAAQENRQDPQPQDIINRILAQFGIERQENRQNPPEQAHAIDNPVQDLDRQRHEMMRHRIQGLMGMEDDGRRQHLWNLMKQEAGGVTTYETPEIQEWGRQQREIIGDQEMQMWDEVDAGTRTEGSMKTRMDNLMNEYILQQMQHILDEVNRRINQ